MRFLSKTDKLNTKNTSNPTKTRDVNDMQPNKIKFIQNVAHLEFLLSTFRIPKLSLTIFRNSE